MSFYARNFIFDSVPSEMYNITISSDGGESSSPIADVELYTVKTWRRSRNYLLGVNQSPVLEFPVIFNTPEELTSEELGLTSAWLFGQQNYKKLQIVQPDMDSIYFNCFLVEPEVIRVGNIIRGVKAKVVCDSPYAQTFPMVSQYTYSVPPSSSSIFFDCFSHDSYYLYPTIEFTMNGTGGGFSIINSTDNARTFSFVGLSPNEVITVNNDLEIITSSLAVLRLSNFNKNFFRLLKGRNFLSVTGNITNLKMTYSLLKKIGG